MTTRWLTLRLATAALLAVSLSGCDKALVTVTVPFARDFAISLDTRTTTVGLTNVTRANLLRDLEIPSDATVKWVDIESVTLELTPSSGNEAATAQVVTLYDRDGLGPLQPANLSANVDVPIAAFYSHPLDALVSGVVAQVTADFKGILMDDPLAPSVVTLGVAAGSITPAGARLLATGILRVRVSLTYESCQNVSAFGIGPQKACPSN